MMLAICFLSVGCKNIVYYFHLKDSLKNIYIVIYLKMFITDKLLFNFSLMLLSWMFISSCTTIYFFECLYFSEYEFCISLYVFFGWERAHQLSTSATGGEWAIHPKCRQLCKEGGVTPHLYVRTYIFFHDFGSIFVLYCLALFVQI